MRKNYNYTAADLKYIATCQAAPAGESLIALDLELKDGMSEIEYKEFRATITTDLTVGQVQAAYRLAAAELRSANQIEIVAFN